MEIIDISNPVTLILVLTFVLFLLFLGKIFKKGFIPSIGLVGLLLLLVYYAICLRNPDLVDYTKKIYNCIGINFVFVFISFFSYLWIDNIEAVVNNKKSYDNSLDWFWDKIK